MFDVGWGTPTPLAAVGIVWDIFGAYALAKGLILDDDTIKRRASSYWDLSPPAARGLCEQRIDAKFGITQLGIGFTLQLISAIGLQVSWLTATSLLLPLALAWGVYRSQAKLWALKASLSFVNPDVFEETWRGHFTDVPDAAWKAVVVKSGVKFKPPE